MTYFILFNAFWLVTRGFLYVVNVTPLTPR